MKPERSKIIVDRIVDFFFPLHWKYKDARGIIPVILYRLGPIHFYYHYIPGHSKEFYHEWCRLDTYDFLTDYYKHFKTKSQIQKILSELPGSGDVWTETGGNGIEGRCRKTTSWIY